MSHLKQQICDVIAAKLIGVVATAGRVYQSSIYALDDSTLPCLLVTDSSDQVVSRSEGNAVANIPRIQQRGVEISIKVVCKIAANVNSQLNAICLDVEKALSVDRFLNDGLVNLTSDFTYDKTDKELSGEAELPIGVAEMTYLAIYWCAETTPDVPNNQ